MTAILSEEKKLLQKHVKGLSRQLSEYRKENEKLQQTIRNQQREIDKLKMQNAELRSGGIR